jgi:peroxiredoxin
MTQLFSGVAAPDFELKSVSGKPIRLFDTLARGRVALVFYKASCPTCQFALPYIQRIHEDNRNVKGHITIWGISQDEADETRDFVTGNGLEFEVLIDEHPYPVSSAYGVEYVPGIFIVEQDGRISLSDFGFSKASLNTIAGYTFMKPDDGLPATRPG